MFTWKYNQNNNTGRVTSVNTVHKNLCLLRLSGVENKQTIKQKNADNTIQYHQQSQEMLIE